MDQKLKQVKFKTSHETSDYYSSSTLSLKTLPDNNIPSSTKCLPQIPFSSQMKFSRNYKIFNHIFFNKNSSFSTKIYLFQSLWNIHTMNSYQYCMKVCQKVTWNEINKSKMFFELNLEKLNVKMIMGLLIPFMFMLLFIKQVQKLELIHKCTNLWSLVMVFDASQICIFFAFLSKKFPSLIL